MIRIVNPIQAVSLPPVQSPDVSPLAELKGKTLGFVDLTDWKNFGIFLDVLERRLRDRFQIGAVERVEVTRRSGQPTIAAGSMERLMARSGAAILGIGA